MKVLIIDDEKIARMNIVKQLDASFSIIESSTFEDAKMRLEKYKFDICYIDLKLDETNEMLGLELIPIASRKGIYTVVMTSLECDEIAEKAYKAGCQDVYNKGNEKAHISETINKYFLTKDTFTENCLFKNFSTTKNKNYESSLKRLAKFVHSDLPILLRGNTGTGKTKLAAAIHEMSKLPGSFVSINCANFSGDTLRSELFGHKKGAFTGAVSDSAGKLLMANKGTIFFDEIGSMSLEMQENLLKFLDDGFFYPVGSSQPVKSEVRIICATLEDLHGRVAKGTFREDVFQRICGYTFTQPELRERKEDILPILKAELAKSRRVVIKEEVKNAIENYDWPGNIRELLNLAKVISREDSGILTLETVNEFFKKSTEKRKTSLIENHQYELIKKIGYPRFEAEFLKDLISRSQEENEGSATRAIAELKISSSTFYKYKNDEAEPKVIHAKDRKEASHVIQ